MAFMKLKTATLSVATVAALVVGCGTSKTEKAPADAPQAAPTSPEDAALAQEYAKLPEGGVIIRVPVDAEGRENVDAAEMRTLSAAVEVSDANAENVFSTGSAPAAVAASELDKDSSTQSWHDWRTAQNIGGGFDRNYTDLNISGNVNSNIAVNVNNGGFGNVGGAGIGGCQGGWCNGGFFNNYIPRAYSAVHVGGFFGFHRPICRLFGGFRYYHWHRPACGAGWCGAGVGHHGVGFGGPGVGIGGPGVGVGGPGVGVGRPGPGW